MKKRFMRIVSALLALATMCLCISVSSFASAPSEAQIARNEEGSQIVSDDIDFRNTINIDQSFAYQVRMATNAADRQVSIGNPIGGLVSGGYGDSLNMSNIGPFYGYSAGEIETDQLSSPENVRTAASDTHSARMYSRKSLLTTVVGNRNGGTTNPSYGYYTYGLLLSAMGFDSVGPNASDATRVAYGTAAQLGYMAASSVNMIFESCFNFLWATNPFLFFKDINATGTGKQVLTDINSSALGEIGANTDNINVLTKYFGNIFNMFTDFAWTVSIPLSLLFIIVSFFLTRRGRYMAGSNIKKFIVRVVFIAIGIPILGSAYTQVLDGLRHTQSSSDEFLSQAVAKTFVDFGAWVETSRLEPLSGDKMSAIVLQRTAGGNADASQTLVKANTLRTLRDLCSELNFINGVISSTTNSLSVSQTGTLLKDYIYSTTGGTLATNSAATGITENYNDRQAISDMLKDYRNGTKYTATMFESGAVSWMQATKRGTTSYGDMLALSVDKYSFSPKATRMIRMLQGEINASGIRYDPNDIGAASTYGDVAQARFNGTDFAGVGYNIWNNGSIRSYGAGETGSGAVHGGELAAGVVFRSPGATGEGDGYACNKVTGLSTMSMYTYLTSEFTQEGIMVYGDSPSVYTHNFHYAVNLIGSNGIMQFAFLANTLAILFGYFMLAVAFVFRTLFDILFKGFQIMGHALLAAAGFYKSIGTCICMVVNMIAQVFVTVVFFSFMVDVMFMLSSIFDNMFLGVFDAVTGLGKTALSETSYRASSSYAAEVLVTLSSLVSALIIVFFVSFATKWRALIMNSINGMVETIIGTCLGVNLSGASDGVAAGMLKSAFNDTKNIAKGAAVAVGGIALVDGAQDMLRDLTSDSNASDEASNEATDAASSDDKPSDKKSAVESAVNPTEGSAFDDQSDEQARLQDGKGLLEGNGSLADSASTVKDDSDAAERPTGSSRADEKARYKYDLMQQKLDKTSDANNKTDKNSPEDLIKDLESKANGPVSIKNVTDDIMNKDFNKAVDNQIDNTTEKAVGSYEYGGTAEQQAQQTLDANSALFSNDNILARNGVGGISYDPQRGVVLSSSNADGTISDVGFGVNGLSMGTTDTAGTKVIQSISPTGTISASRQAADGTGESVSVTGGAVTASTSTALSDGRIETIEIDEKGNKNVTYTNASVFTAPLSGATISSNSSASAASAVRHIEVGGMSIDEEVDTKLNVVKQVLNTDSGNYDVFRSANDNVVISTTRDGFSYEFINNPDGSSVYTMKTDNGLSRCERTYVGDNSESEKTVEYLDAIGASIIDESVIADLDKQFDDVRTDITANITNAYFAHKNELESAGVNNLFNK